MKQIILISCVSRKLNHQAKAKDLYKSPLFLGSLKYAINLKPDNIFILSAKYGILELDRVIEPYDMTLNDMSITQVKMWADKVIEQLNERANLQSDHFIFLAGERYRKYIAPHMASYEVPLKGMRIGKQLHYLSIQNT